MSFVHMTALTFPEGAGPEIEQRFAARQKAVDSAPGFQSFTLLRPVFGESRYFVVTTWDSQIDFETWAVNRPPVDHSEDERRGMKVEPLGFEVVPLEG